MNLSIAKNSVAIWTSLKDAEVPVIVFVETGVEYPGKDVSE